MLEVVLVFCIVFSSLVIPVKTGIYKNNVLDPRLRGDDSICFSLLLGVYRLSAKRRLRVLLVQLLLLF